MQSPPQPNTIPHPSHRKKHFSGIAVYQESGMARVSSVHGNRGEQRERDSAWSVGPKLWTGLLDCWWDYRGSTRLIWPVTWITIALRGIFSDESTCFTAWVRESSSTPTVTRFFPSSRSTIVTPGTSRIAFARSVHALSWETVY